MDVRHLNQEELAERWNISPRTLERRRWLKQPPAYLKIFGRVVYRLEDIEAFEARSIRGSDEQSRSAQPEVHNHERG